MSDSPLISIEVVYALPEKQTLISLMVPIGTRAAEAIKLSGILTAHQEIDLSKSRIGIFSTQCRIDVMVQEGDRIEIYRPLIANPKNLRRERAEQTIARKKGQQKLPPSLKNHTD